MAASLSRRRVLQWGVLGAGLLTVLTVAGRDLSRQGPVTGLLSARELAALTAIAARICPGVPGLAGAVELGVVPRVVDFVSTADAQSQADLAALLRVFASRWGGLLLDGRFSAFTSLGAEAQDAVLDQWRRSPLALKRRAFIALRTLVVSRYWADPRAYAATGYPGPPRFATPETGPEDAP